MRIVLFQRKLYIGMKKEGFVSSIKRGMQSLVKPRDLEAISVLCMEVTPQRNTETMFFCNKFYLPITK